MMLEALLMVSVLVASSLSQGRVRLAVAGVLLPGLTVVCSLHFDAGVGELVVAAVFAVATGMAWAGVIPAPPATQVATAVGSGVALAVALSLARLASGLTPALAVVVFAVVFTALELIGSRASPYGEWGSLAHSQARQPWALAVAAFGPQAVTFALAFVSGGVGYAVALASPGAALSAAVGLGVVLLMWGLWLRSSRRHAGSQGHQVVGLIERNPELFAVHVAAFVGGRMSPDSWKEFDAQSRQSVDDMLERSLSAGRAGARVAVWAEGAGLVIAKRAVRRRDELRG